MQFLKANTEVKVVVGPFVNFADGLVPQVGVDISTADEAEIMKHDAAHDEVTDISGATWAAITGCDGYYVLTLTTALTDTEGMLTVVVQDDSVCLPVRATFMVLAEAAYDSLFAVKDTGFMDVNIKTVGRADAQETEANNLESACSNYSATRGLTGTALPAAVADASGGLMISDDGGWDADELYDAIITDATGANIAIDITTAQTDLDTITGTGGALIATDAMDRSGTLDVNTKTLTANVITAAAINGDAITEAKIADNAIAGEHLNATACTKIIDDFETQSQADPTGFHVNVKEVNGTAQAANDNSTDINAILTDTDELQVAWTNAGRLDAILDSILAMLDDARGEPVDTAPPVNPDAMTKLDYLYKFLRNKIETTPTKIHVYNDAQTNKDHTSDISTSGTTFTRGEFGAGDA